MYSLSPSLSDVSALMRSQGSKGPVPGISRAGHGLTLVFPYTYSCQNLVVLTQLDYEVGDKFHPLPHDIFQWRYVVLDFNQHLPFHF